MPFDLLDPTSPWRDLQDKLAKKSKTCPDGARKFFAFIHFTDESTCLFANIFTFSRTFATMLVMEKFSYCLEYVSSINIHEQEY